MYTLGFVLFFGGLLVGLIAFIVAALNMKNAMKGSASNMFSNHIGAMILMIIGGLTLASGSIILIVTALHKLIG